MTGEDGRWMNSDLRGLHRRALDVAGSYVGRVEGLDGGTPCAGWDLGTLLAHCVGQHYGFATAVADGDAPVEAYAHRPVSVDRLSAEWQDSADRLTAAFAAAPLDRPVRLVEISAEQRFPAGTAVGFQLLDTVIHTWDVATTLGARFVPDDELAQVTVTLARLIPQGESRLSPTAAFAPVVDTFVPDPWTEALALTGRKV
jgi:uncharacterized protein (TIGR03086 family)